MNHKPYKYYKILFLSVTISCLFTSCYKDKNPNLDIKISGQIMDVNSGGIANVTVYIDKGKSGNFMASTFSRYDSVLTNSEGKYFYLIKQKQFHGSYRVCSDTPPGYSKLEIMCKVVEVEYLKDGMIPNVINFNFIR